MAEIKKVIEWNFSYNPYHFTFQNYQYQKKVDKLLIPSDHIRDRIRALAGIVTEKEHLKNKEFTLLTIANGGIPFSLRLQKRLREYGVNNFEEYQFKVSSYKNGISTNEFTIEKKLNLPKNKPVVIVEDLIDNGDTMQFLYKLVEKYTSQIIPVTLLQKGDNFTPKYDTYIGFRVPKEHFLVGFGMDAPDGSMRDLEHICTLKPEYF